MTKLKPCPFCGGEALLEPYRARKGYEASIQCNQCLCSMSTITYDEEETAIEDVVKAWNRRVNEERMLDFPVKYTEICALYHFCVDLGIKCTIERLHDGYAVRFPDGSDFAQHHGTYGGTEGCVEPAIGDSEFDYTAVGLNLAKELVKKHKGKLEADHA